MKSNAKSTKRERRPKMSPPSRRGSNNRYHEIVEKVFFDHYASGKERLEFRRDELVKAATRLRIPLPKNLGDILYSVRYRGGMPRSITKTERDELEWIVEGTGRGSYAFHLVQRVRIAPNPALVQVKIPDSTPEIVGRYALSDEQALLAKVRYNRLVDIFLGLVAYSLQNHLRTTVAAIGQVEIDEIYVGIDRQGRQYVLPVQAKGGTDQLSTVQASQDMAYCVEAFPHLICRAVSAQFMEDDLIALFELTSADGRLSIVDEKHYRLVPAEEIGDDDLEAYASRP